MSYPFYIAILVLIILVWIPKINEGLDDVPVTKMIKDSAKVVQAVPSCLNENVNLTNTIADNVDTIADNVNTIANLKSQDIIYKQDLSNKTNNNTSLINNLTSKTNTIRSIQGQNSQKQAQIQSNSSTINYYNSQNWNKQNRLNSYNNVRGVGGFWW